jgi:hypothetical protein
MKKTTTLLAAAIVSLVAGLGITTDSNAQSSAPSSMSDQAYCLSLYKALREYGTGTARGGLPVGVATAVAIGQCQEGNPGPAIPVLEQQLHDRRIPVPSRG